MLHMYCQLTIPTAQDGEVIIPRKNLPTAASFELCGRYVGNVFRTGSSTYCIQFFEKKTLQAVTESEKEPVLFQAYKSIVTDAIGIWTPCWTEATDFGKDGTRKVFFTFDKVSSMKFVDKTTGKCSVTLSHAIQVEDGG